MEEAEQGLDLIIPPPETERARVLDTIHKMVREGSLGTDYTIVNRPKNRWLRQNYHVNDAKIREILLNLKIEHFVKAEGSNHPAHPDDVVYIFKMETPLMPRWQENADDVTVKLYIKIVQPVENTIMLIISFHEDNI